MNKLQLIRQKAQESIDDYADMTLTAGKMISEYDLEKGRAELAEEILEILNGEVK